VRTHRLTLTAVVAAALVSGCTDDGTAGDPTSSSTSEPAASPAQTPATSDPSESSVPSESTVPSESSQPSSPTGVATGELVEGFPTDVVPLLPDSTITVSTLTPGEGSRTVSLSGTTATPADQVLAFYRTSLVGQGFVETAGGQAAGFPTATFTRAGGADLLVVAVSTLEGVQTFTIGGTLAG